jgi:hypothetical protein
MNASPLLTMVSVPLIQQPGSSNKKILSSENTKPKNVQSVHKLQKASFSVRSHDCTRGRLSQHRVNALPPQLRISTRRCWALWATFIQGTSAGVLHFGESTF